MNTAVIALTKAGCQKAAEIATIRSRQGDKVHLLLPLKFCDMGFGNKEEEAKDYVVDYFESEALSSLILEQWKKHQKLIFVMALGIVVRKLAPLIEHKAKDPAVVVIDEKGQFVISVLSGHLGGANQLATELAKALKAVPVITTATDVQGKLAFDLLAKKYKLLIEDYNLLKIANGALVNNQDIDLLLDQDLEAAFITEGFSKEVRLASVNFADNVNLSRISNKALNKPKVFITNKTLDFLALQLNQDRSLILRPKNLFVGVGCRKGVPTSVVKTVILEVLKELKLSSKSIAALGSIDIKRNEQALLETAADWDLPLSFFTASEIIGFQKSRPEVNFSYSAFVEKEIGVGGVCEPVALMMKKNAVLLQPKTGRRGVTVAIAEVSYGWWE